MDSKVDQAEPGVAPDQEADLQRSNETADPGNGAIPDIPDPRNRPDVWPATGGGVQIEVAVEGCQEPKKILLAPRIDKGSVTNDCLVKCPDAASLLGLSSAQLNAGIEELRIRPGADLYVDVPAPKLAEIYAARPEIFEHLQELAEGTNRRVVLECFPDSTIEFHPTRFQIIELRYQIDHNGKITFDGANDGQRSRLNIRRMKDRVDPSEDIKINVLETANEVFLDCTPAGIKSSPRQDGLVRVNFGSARSLKNVSSEVLAGIIGQLVSGTPDASVEYLLDKRKKGEFDEEFGENLNSYLQVHLEQVLEGLRKIERK